MRHFEDVGQGCLRDMLEQRQGEEPGGHGRTKGRMIQALGNGGGADSVEEKGLKGILNGIDKGQGHEFERCNRFCGCALSSVALTPTMTTTTNPSNTLDIAHPLHLFMIPMPDFCHARVPNPSTSERPVIESHDHDHDLIDSAPSASSLIPPVPPPPCQRGLLAGCTLSVNPPCGGGV